MDLWPYGVSPAELDKKHLNLYQCLYKKYINTFSHLIFHEIRCCMFNNSSTFIILQIIFNELISKQSCSGPFQFLTQPTFHSSYFTLRCFAFINHPMALHTLSRIMQTRKREKWYFCFIVSVCVLLPWEQLQAKNYCYPLEIWYSRFVSNINYTLCDAKQNELLADREFKCANLGQAPLCAVPHKSRILLFETKTAVIRKYRRTRSGICGILYKSISCQIIFVNHARLFQYHIFIQIYTRLYIILGKKMYNQKIGWINFILENLEFFTNLQTPRICSKYSN